MPGSSMGRSSGRNWAKKIFWKKACIRQAFGVMSPLATGCGSVWLERSVRDAEAARSNRAIPTIKNGRVPVKLEPVFLWLQSGCILSTVGPCNGGEGWPAFQPKAVRPLSWPGAVGGARSQAVRVPASRELFHGLIAAPAFAGNIWQTGGLSGCVPVAAGSGERARLALSALVNAGRRTAAVA